MAVAAVCASGVKKESVVNNFRDFRFFAPSVYTGERTEWS